MIADKCALHEAMYKKRGVWKMEKHAHNNHSFAPGHWMPRDQKTLIEWMKKIMDKADKCDKPLLPVVENFKHFIENAQ